MDLGEAIATYTQGIDEAEGRYYGLLHGSVVKADDSQNLGRVKIRIDGMADGVSSDWALPMWPGAMEGIPKVGDPCVVAFIDGNPMRPVYWIYPRSTTSGRPSEEMALGRTLVALHNGMVDRINTMRTDLYTTFQTLYNAHTHGGVTVGAGVTGAPGVVWTSTDPGAPGKGQAADRSTVASTTTDSVALSGRAKVI